MTENNRNPAIKAAKRSVKQPLDGPIQLSTGYWVRIRPVSAHLIDGAQAMVPTPQPPMVYIEQKDREEENPNDPAYLRELERLDVVRSLAATDAMILFGVELVTEDGSPYELPPDNQWLNRLQLMERRGLLDLSEYDLDDPLDKEFAFKKFVVISSVDLPVVAMANGVQGMDIENALNTFPGDETRPAD